MDAVGRGFILVGVSVSTLILLVFSSPAFAAEYGNIGGKPARPRADNPRSQSIFIHEIEPNSSVEDAIEVVNFTQSTKTLQVYATDSIVSSGGAFGCAQQADTAEDVGSWIRLTRNEVTLAAGETTEIPFTISTPDRPQVGENNGCIVVQEKNGDTQRVEDEEGSGVSISFRTAIRVAVWIPGDIKKDLTIVGYAASGNDDRSFSLKPRVQNSGNVSVDTVIRTESSNLFGGEKAITEQQYPVLRGATSDWNINYKPSFWGGWYKSQFTATYDSNVANGIGESVDEQLVTLESETIRFFAMPHPAALLIEAGILAIIGGLLYRLWLLWKRKRKVSEEWQMIIIDTQTDIVSLAEQFGVSWKLMAKVNKLKPPYILKPGDAIRVPAQVASSVNASQHTAQVVTIEAPTDISSLAEQYGVNWKKLAKLNKVKEPYILKPGDIIKIPAADSGESKLAKLKNLRKRVAPEQTETIVVDAHTDIVSFAQTHGMDWKKLAKLNKLKPPYILKPGYVVLVPKQAPKQIGQSLQSLSSLGLAAQQPVPATPSAPIPPVAAIAQPQSPAPMVEQSVQPVAPATTYAPTTPQAQTPQPQPTPAPAAPVHEPAPTPAPAPEPVVPAPAPTFAPVPEPVHAPQPPEPIVYAPAPQPQPQHTYQPPAAPVHEPVPTPPPAPEPITPAPVPTYAPVPEPTPAPLPPEPVVYSPVLPPNKPDAPKEERIIESELAYEEMPIEKLKEVKVPEPKEERVIEAPKAPPKPAEPPKPKVFKIQDVQRVRQPAPKHLGHKTPPHPRQSHSDHSAKDHDPTE